MGIDLTSLPERITRLDIAIDQPLGTLTHDTHYRFQYLQQADEQVALAMPIQAAPYTRGALYPIFEMNLPEGYVRRYISERLQRYTRVSDMLFLAIHGNEGIGRLKYSSTIKRTDAITENLDDIVNWNGRSGLFNELLDRHLFNTTVSGMQPKVLVRSDKAALIEPNLIIKTGGDEYPNLALNEFVCMSIAKAVGLDTPNFWLSKNRDLFIMERFDLKPGLQYGMEDFAVLMGRSGDQRYLGSYENAAKVVSVYTGNHEQTSNLFDYIALSCLLGNGDAHLKNFALLYAQCDGDKWLSPLYDVICNQVYELEAKTLALKMNKSHAFPTFYELLQFGKTLGIKDANDRIIRMADIAMDTLNKLDEAREWKALHNTLRKCISHATAIKQSQVGYRVQGKDIKRRKTDALLHPKS